MTQQWQREAVLSGHQIFVNRYAGEGAWDAMAVLTFSDTNALARWHRIEKEAPGGLDQQALGLAVSIQTAQVDLFQRGGGPAVQAKVRERLAKVASWKAISDNKQAIREEGQMVVADQVAP